MKISVLQVVGFLIAAYLASVTFASLTQVAMYSQDLPANMVCVKDSFPDGYICRPDADVPWYLSSEGVLAHAEPR